MRLEPAFRRRERSLRAVSDRRCASNFIPQCVLLLLMLIPSITLAEPNASNSNAAPPVTFSNQVVRIFQNSCQNCHRPGWAAPMPLLTYQQARPWAKSIKQKVLLREMPPWFADREIGEYHNDPSLTEHEIQTIARWVDAGAPEGNPSDLPPPLNFDKEWNIGQPDLILAMDEEYEVEATGEDRYVEFSLPTGLTEDRYVRAVEVRPGDPKVVHHVLVFVHQPDDFDFSEEFAFGNTIGSGGTLVTEYALGNLGDVFPPGTGRLLKAGSELRLEIHYHPSGEATRDRTRIAFTFHPRGAEPKRVISRAIGNFRFRLPANASGVKTEAEYRFERAVDLLSFQPHMHGRGKAMTMTALYPDGKTEVLSSIPRYDFSWQLTYHFAEPRRLPAGSVLQVTGLHDNSAENPNNPDPNVPVFFGRTATDEMMHCWTDFVYVD